MTAPSMEVVRKMRPPQTTGELCPRPGISVFQRTFFCEFHSEGRSFSEETPFEPGPRHWGQFSPEAAEARRQM
jgi:hypothetical protein